jgi:hypothetical protein
VNTPESARSIIGKPTPTAVFDWTLSSITQDGDKAGCVSWKSSGSPSPQSPGGHRVVDAPLHVFLGPVPRTWAREAERLVVMSYEVGFTRRPRNAQPIRELQSSIGSPRYWTDERTGHRDSAVPSGT